MRRVLRAILSIAILAATLLAADPMSAADSSAPASGEVPSTADGPQPGAGAEGAQTPAEGTAEEEEASPDEREAKLEESITVETKRLSEELVYTVTRTPERAVNTPRAVQVITSEQIRRKAPFELSDVLLQESGFFISPAGNGGGSVIVRGLASRQVLVMIDGVKLNNSTWRTFSDVKEHFNLLDPSEIERIEILRGVVSVLGSEALGGVINIITKKGSDEGEGFGVSLTTRYSSADQGKGGALQLYGRGKGYRYIGGVSGIETADLTTGGGIKEPHTAYRRRSGHVHFDYSPSTERTLSLGYRAFERDSKYLSFLNSPLIADADVDPMRMQMATIRYDDVTSRRWEDSIAITASWNRQDDGRRYLVRTPVIENFYYNSDAMMGLNLELGKFVGSHRLIYGVDHTRERLHSSSVMLVGANRVEVSTPPDYVDGGRYDATAVYLNDQFGLSKWLTITAGARYGKYVSSGRSVLPGIGSFDAASSKSNVTTSLNVVLHATGNLNFVGNYVRGYRPPNMHDMTLSSSNALFAFVPSTGLEAERMNSLELGVKYDSGRFTSSLFYFDNELSNLLVNAAGTFQGINFLDYNNDGRRNLGEPAVLVTTNVGKASVKGHEVDFRWLPTANLTLWGNYARTTGTNNDSRQTLSRIQPRLANMGARLASEGHRLWAEAVFSYGSESVGTTGEKFPGFEVYTLRTGAAINDRLSLTVGFENLFDTDYRLTPSIALVDQPGRQVVLVTELRF
jgi:hemoglobin/transferrin/lactoferrin receptor protein